MKKRWKMSGVDGVKAFLAFGVVLLVAASAMGLNSVPSSWSLDTVPGAETPAAGLTWAYHRGGAPTAGADDDNKGAQYAWDENGATGVIMRYSPSTGQWYKPTFQWWGVGDQYITSDEAPGTKPTPRRGACMVFFENPDWDLWTTESAYNAIVISGGENAVTGVPIGEVNIFKWPSHAGFDFQPFWDVVTYTYPEPTSFAVCAQRTWFGNAILGEIDGVTYYGGKKDAAGATNDDVWFFDTDTLQWYFVMDLYEASRWGAAFTSYDNHPGEVGYKDGVLFYGGFGVGVGSNDAVMCHYAGANQLQHICEFPDNTVPESPGSPGAVGATWARHAGLVPSAALDVGLAMMTMEQFGFPGRVWVGDVVVLNSILYLQWEAFIPVGSIPQNRYAPGLMCIDDMMDCRTYTSSSNPTRFVMWSGEGFSGQQLSTVYMLTFNPPGGGTPPGGCPKCPKPVPV